ncbi:hypothetical protein OGAPHI_000588 [Ogataea philodendri]|uniref:Uncharacterized protein n=1 Tax=Ogataea philodendri TaxID=1378263 RepID=A0A9P8PF46_9ASCO|nr:uncharacterized protein OGAPHI_000588 [Ogataea philodendri]KAH3670877.1 hypothetical protein OGAPHI_000588 [Ogataea philodendri]
MAQDPQKHKDVPDVVRAENVVDPPHGQPAFALGSDGGLFVEILLSVELDTRKVPDKAPKKRDVKVKRVGQTSQEDGGAKSGHSESRKRHKEQNSHGTRLWFVEELGPGEKHTHNARNRRESNEAELRGWVLFQSNMLGGDNRGSDQHCDSCVVDTGKPLTQIKFCDAVVRVPDDRRQKTFDGGHEKEIGDQLIAEGRVLVNVCGRVMVEH